MGVANKNQRGVTLNAEAYARIERAAVAAGESVAAYLTRAADQRRRRESAQAYAAFIARPEVAGELAAHRREISAYRTRRDAELLERDPA